MGCDIHMEVERRGKDGLWHLVPHQDRPCDNSYCDGGVVNREHPRKEEWGRNCYRCKGKGHYTRRAYSERDYNVFAILADVRNGGYEPISPPRGLPDDLSVELKEHLDYVEAMTSEDWEKVDLDEDGAWNYELGDHSFTCFTYEELLSPAYWQKVIPSSGWVDPWSFGLLRQGHHPNPDLFLNSFEDQAEFVSHRFMARLLDSGRLVWTTPPPDEYDWKPRHYRIKQPRRPARIGTTKVKARQPHYLTWADWEITYGEEAQDFLAKISEFMQAIGNPPPSEVRLVMGFDN